MACGYIDCLQGRNRLSANFNCVGAARVERATCRWVDGAWWITLQDSANFALVGYDSGNGAQQRVCVGMASIVKQAVTLSNFDNAAQVHYGYPVCEVMHNREIVAYKEIGEVELFAYILH